MWQRSAFDGGASLCAVGAAVVSTGEDDGALGVERSTLWPVLAEGGIGRSADGTHPVATSSEAVTTAVRVSVTRADSLAQHTTIKRSRTLAGSTRDQQTKDCLSGQERQGPDGLTDGQTRGLPRTGLDSSG